MDNYQPITSQLQQRDRVKPASVVAGGGFKAEEAKQLLELCIELNNQDDRNNPNLQDSKGNFLAKPVGWKLFYDSRHPGNTEWNRHWPYAANEDNSDDKDPNDPENNGLQPLNNAWLLAQSETDPSQFAIAIRGTISDRSSILADAYATTIPAYAGFEYPKNNHLPILLAATPQAEVHLGFAYAMFSVLFDSDRGILAQLHKIKQSQKISKIFITGHSQGAAVATLLHAFLYYAVTDPQDRYRLGLDLALDANSISPGQIQLKSYVFAQPKPGNLQFSQDFARITKDAAFVINNDRDPVAQVPLSLETVSEVANYVEEDNVSIGSSVDRLIGHITDIKNNVRAEVSGLFTNRLADKFDKANIKQSMDTYFPESEKIPAPQSGKSLNYTLAGQLIPVFGLKEGGDLYPLPTDKGKRDILLQHHATSYRALLAKQLD